MLKKIRREYQIIKAYKDLKKIILQKKYIFFFPFYHIGGAERVHINILNVFNKADCLCIITERSINTGFKDEFEKNASLFELEDYNLNYKSKKKLFKKLNRVIVKSPVKTVFGSNTVLFYDLLQTLPPQIKSIDLFHAFTFENPHALEIVSLKLVPQINKRIVLGNRTKNDFKALYSKYNIDSKYLDLIAIIKNKIDFTAETFKKQSNKVLNVLFIGRNSKEKRPELFFKIIENCKKQSIDLNITVIGNFISLEKKYKTKNVTFTGEIFDKKRLNTYYKKSDLLLITSSREGLPMVILESMVFGVVPISTNVGEIAELVNKDTGFLIDNYLDEDALIDAFTKQIVTINKDRKQLIELQNNVQTVVKSNYNSELFNTNYKSLFAD